MLKGNSIMKRPTRTLGLRHCRGIAEILENAPMVEVLVVWKADSQLACLIDAIQQGLVYSDC